MMLLDIGVVLASSPPTIKAAATKPASDDQSRSNLFATPILVIEDEAMIAWMMEEFLSNAGFTTITLSPDCKQAVADAAKLAPGLILSDVNLGPGPDGIAAVRLILSKVRAPVIFITGYADDDMRLRLAKELPEAQLLRKPVQAEALSGAVMRALAN